MVDFVCVDSSEPVASAFPVKESLYNTPADSPTPGQVRPDSYQPPNAEGQMFRINLFVIIIIFSYYFGFIYRQV